MPNEPDYAQRAIRSLRRKDPTLRPIITRIGPYAPDMVKHRFTALVWSIISQQISIQAARTIKMRVLEAIKPARLKPESILALTPAQMRSAGLSTAKAKYLRDLAEQVESGQVRLSAIHRKDNEAVIEELIQVKGIGRWTAEMFLLFSLGRPDVLPVDDLGLRVAIQKLDDLPELPDKQYTLDRGAKWRPWASVATWYLWQSLK